MAEYLRGVGVSPGTVAGPALRMAPPPQLPPPVPVADPESEIARAAEGLAAIGVDLMARAGRCADVTAASVLEAQAMIAADPVLLEGVEANIRAGMDAPHAIDAALAWYRRQLVAAGGHLAERAADLDYIRDRAVAASLNQPMPVVPVVDYPYILVADDLAPADTVGLDPDKVLAMITARGGPTSHTAILARSLGLPAIVACAGAMSIVDGVSVVVDGATGEVRVGVAPDVVAEVQRRHAARPQRHESTGPGRTKDGSPVTLLLNIGSAGDLTADTSGAEGVGLFRTEFLFLDRQTAPTTEEQEIAYTEVFQALDGRPIVIRTLDAGADKPLPFLQLPPEPNPALGVRGLRVCRSQPDVLTQQLVAIARATKATGAAVSVMAPMVSTTTEAADFVALSRSHGLPVVGAMVEVPAAAIQAQRLLEMVDFLSIGTNDLGQYTLAADRQSGDLADLLDPWQPALLYLIRRCAAAGQAAHKPVGVCGEAAADPFLAIVLTGLGVTSLSMSARSIAAVRDALATLTLADCVRYAALALSSATAAEAREAVLAAHRAEVS